MTLHSPRIFAASFASVCLLSFAGVRVATGSPPSAACPGTSSATAIATTTTSATQQPGDPSAGTALVPGSTALTTTTATSAPPLPVYEIVPESVSINEADEFTSSVAVSVNIVGPGAWKGTMGAATRAELSNDGGFKSSKFFDLTNSKAVVDWTLDAAREGTFTKIVYVRFWNCYGAPAFSASTLSDDIILDNTKPVIVNLQASASSARGKVQISRTLEAGARHSSVKLSVRGSDSISGVGSIEVRATPRQTPTVIAMGGSSAAATSKAQTISRSVVLSTVLKRLQVRLVDRAGNGSSWRTISVAG